MKVFFDAGEVDFLVILPSDINQVKAHINQKEFHVFDADECVSIFCENDCLHSKKRAWNQMDDQKVIFRNSNIQLGEIELRTDPSMGWMKMWLDSKKVLSFLQQRINETGNSQT